MATNWTRDEQIAIANTIIEQLGGHHFRVMTGAKNFMALDSGLSFQLPNPRKANGIKAIRVILEADDTYTVQSYKANISAAPSVYLYIYCDQLRSLFEEITGLCTSLGTMSREG